MGNFSSSPSSPLSPLSSSRIWLIGGTSESGVLAEALAQNHLPSTITVTTEVAKRLYSPSPLLRVKVGRLNRQQVADFLRTENIVAILDASHPHAAEISKLAIGTAAKYDIPYLRYERLELSPPTLLPQGGEEKGESPPPPLVKGGEEKGGSPPTPLVKGGEEKGGSPPPPLVKGGEEKGESPPLPPPLLRGAGGDPVTLDSFETLVGGDYLTNKRVLLTSGYKSLHLFRDWHDRSTLFVRVLPSVESLQGAIAAGFAAKSILAIRPPVSRELEKALWQQWQISLVVAKASGVAGGEDIKRSLSAELGIPLIIIERPNVNYPQQTRDLAAAIEFCHRQFRSND
ncbi:MAG: precorrin-6A/cobalt-precorrin-6A reductase [Cyanobacteriota bacterium]|nr:precorrin-6A/cobalt-precorrin-6A reductase [Cyanobacteriota bacterium]